MGTPDAAPVGEVTISDLVISEKDKQDKQDIIYDPVPYIHPAIDPNKRSAIMNEGYGDIIESGRQDFGTLDAEFQKNKLNRELLDGNEDLVDPNKIDYSNITEILSRPGYNLKPDIIQQLLNYNPSLLNEEDINSTLSNFYQSEYIN